MSKRIWSVLILCACVAACTQSRYGNFAKQIPPAYNLQLANDTARQLTAVYPPASTALHIEQPATDDYGMALLRSLREAGYAVREFDPRARTGAPTASTAPEQAQALNYIVDAPEGGNFYRVTVLLGSESLSRGYAAQNGRLRSLGAWVRKE
ncbi:conjugal transfer protein TrbH [Pseudomonas nitroreducens]|uniref:conjugal transfer protein TrbH n=1 Tax=Pseudomonas nitroreducens TaxID=46680 RepID=UPI003CC82B44